MKILTADGGYIKSQITDVERSELERKNREAEVQYMYFLSHSEVYNFLINIVLQVLHISIAENCNL